ncbi:MAG: LysR family transcriptional regulator [Sulfuricurvum sp.]|jgi:DNA-binding transcriptional LysR family regulator|uniref:LysR family transcriptional regulator n=1 Tax=Sulfuricurvum sp. TaxID=2025608 RepID=UPI0025E4DCDE|nr:LysR family transcriptional regulator [Sulfuricurvum sp.]MCK9373044.1 LysR family transcriptional regulator [Sulfuricurvum sp.]
MLKDFAKLITFLTVVREKSFSKASAKLGISQPAVTQQIKFIEDYLDTRVVERKKNGIKLTKEGEDLYRIAIKLEKAIQSSEKELLKIINKEFTFIIGASYAIGNYVLPSYLGKLKEKINNEVHIRVAFSEEIIDQLLEKQIDIALIESPIFKEGIIYREWEEDELVIFSNQPLPKQLRKEDLYKFDWICRDENSHTRKLTAEVFEEIGVECSGFSVIGVVASSTAIKETILRSPKEAPRPVVSVISRHVISDEVEEGKLFEARIKNFKIKRKFYIAYSKERKHDAFIDNVVTYLLGLKL